MSVMIISLLACHQEIALAVALPLASLNLASHHQRADHSTIHFGLDTLYMTNLCQSHSALCHTTEMRWRDYLRRVDWSPSRIPTIPFPVSRLPPWHEQKWSVL
jgi:hypothetical protein